MKPKRISRVTSPIATQDKSNAFVGILDGKASLIDVGSGFEDESMMTGEVDVEALRESGMTDEEIADAQYELEEKIMEKILGESAKAYTMKAD